MTDAAQARFSKIQFFGRPTTASVAKSALREERRERFAKLQAILDGSPELNDRFTRLQQFAGKVRVSEYHITNACNIRCQGCWFFEYEHDKETKEEKRLDALDAFLRRERQSRKINAAMIIGGEPSLFPQRLAVFARHLDYLMVSSNGLEPIPMEGFENITIALSLFGGGPLDDDPQAMRDRDALVAEALRVRALYPDTVISHPYYIRTMITGDAHWARFGYDVCPSISVDHPGNAARLANGNPFLPSFNTWSPDLETLKFCCTSGSCDGCRDSQVVFSWLLVAYDRFVESEAQFRDWVDIAESYWRQMRWSPYHKTAAPKALAA